MNDLEMNFLEACITGNLKAVTDLVDKVNINVRDCDEHGNGTGFTGLIEALHSKRYDIAEFLIKKGIDVNVESADGDTALFFCGQNTQIAEMILARGADINHKSDYGSTPLIYASTDGEGQLALYLIKKGANLECKTKYGNTALMEASKIETKEELIKNGADINAQNNNGFSALMHAIVDNKKDVIQLLLNAGTDLTLTNKKNKTALDMLLEFKLSEIILKNNLLNLQDKNGDTLLMKSCEQRNEYKVLFLRDNGADFTIENNKGDSAYNILKRKRVLSPKLQALKEKLILDKEIDTHDVLIPQL